LEAAGYSHKSYPKSEGIEIEVASTPGIDIRAKLKDDELPFVECKA
jgi:hypothetical protein